MQLGEILGKEKLGREYKVFCLNKHHREAWLSLTNNNYGDFFEIIKLNVNKYIDKFFYKYFTSFYNLTSTDVKNGEFYLGVSDDGEVIGIPYNKIVFMDIEQTLYKKIKRLLQRQFSRGESNKIFKHIKSSMKIEVITLQTDGKTDDTLEDFINNEEKELENYNSVNNQYIESKKKWTTEVEKYRQAINKMINNNEVRTLLIDFVKEYNPENKDVEQKELEKIRRSILSEIEEAKDTLIEFDISIIDKTKNDINRLEYWVTEFRDKMADDIIARKPKFHNMRQPMPPYFSVFNDFRILHSHFEKNNIPICLLKIVFPTGCNLPYTHQTISYWSHGVKYTPVRYLLNDEPSTKNN